MKQCAKDLNTLAQKIANDAKTKFGPTVDKVKDGIDVVKAGADVVSTVVSDVTGDNVTIRSIQKGAADFDVKWDAFAKEINDMFNAASPAGKADILETFVKSNFGDDIFNLGSAIKNELPGVLDGLADYKEVVDSFGVGAKTAEEKAKKIQSGADKIIKATEKVAGSLNEAVKTCTGKGYPVLDQLSKIGGTAAVDNLNKALNLGVAGATTATAANELKNAVKSGDLRGITDAMAKGATSVNDLLSQLNTLVPGFPKAQIPTQITTSIKRLQDGQAVYDAARSTLTALVADASGPMTVASLATLTSHFDKNWDNFSDKIDALFQVTPGKGQQAVLETVAKSMFGENVFYAGGAIKRQLPGVLTGVAGVQEAINTFGGSYRDPIEAATKIRSGVEKMVQSVEKISQSLNNMVKFYQGKGDISKGTGYPLLDTLGKLGDTKGIKALDTALRIGGGAAAVVGNAGALSEAIKNKDIKGTIAAAKKTIDDIKKLTKKGEYKADKLTIGNTSGSGNGGNTGKAANAQNNQQQQNQNNNNQKQLSGAATNSYVCSGATMRCTMGTSQASLTVLPIRTVNLTGKPMANISDHLSFVNLGQFGRCRSLGFPATAAATAAAHGKLTPMPCVHNTPFPWMGGKNDYIIKGDPALLKSSKCQCMWGGTISLVNDGQTYTGPADLSMVSREEFKKDQVKKVSNNGIPPKPIHINISTGGHGDGENKNNGKHITDKSQTDQNLKRNGRYFKEQLSERMRQAKEIGPDIQKTAEIIAKKYGATCTPINYKTESSIIRKCGGDLEELNCMKDLVRTTIIVPNSDSEDEITENIIKELSKLPNLYRIKKQTPEKDPLGYSGCIVNVIGDNGLYAEIQVNTESMIYAKEKDAESIIGSEAFNRIQKQTGCEPGLGHTFYEEWRALDPKDPRREEIERESKDYYSNFRKKTI
jgi:hypothetical protein